MVRQQLVDGSETHVLADGESPEGTTLNLVGVDDVAEQEMPDDLGDTPPEADDGQDVEEGTTDDTVEDGIGEEAEPFAYGVAGGGPALTPSDAVYFTAGAERRLFEMRQRVREMAQAEALAHEAYKAAKKSTEGAQEAMNQFIDEVANAGGTGTLWEASNTGTPRHAVGVLSTGGDAGGDSGGQAWRSEPIDALEQYGVATSTIKRLKEHRTVDPIETLGKLADYTAGQYAQLTDIDGIGAGKAAKIEEALMRWFVANPDKCPPVKGAGEAPMEVEETPETPETDEAAEQDQQAPTLEWSAGDEEAIVATSAVPVDGPSYQYMITPTDDGRVLLGGDDELIATEIMFDNLAEAKEMAEQIEREKLAAVADSIIN